MITRIEALNFRCLHYVSQPLESFHVLVGPNASGKTTFLDVVAFLGRLVQEGLEPAVQECSENFRDLVWGRQGNRFELALEAAIPESRRALLPEEFRKFDTIRYMVAVAENPETNEIELAEEQVLLKVRAEPSPASEADFPVDPQVPTTLHIPHGDERFLHIVQKNRLNWLDNSGELTRGFDLIQSETLPHGKRENFPLRLGRRKSALANLPGDEFFFPTTTWLKTLLSEGVQQIRLNSLLMRRASPPGKGQNFLPDGSNLPWVIEHFKKKAPQRFRDWIAHLQTALPDIVDVRTVVRRDDRHRYLTIRYRNGVEVPSWTASDGTLRLMALTLPAYLPDFIGVYLIEEPENGIHPRAVETVFQSLSSVYDAQILLATHSPVILSLAEAKHILCFAKTEDGATGIVRGDQHPLLRDWQGETNLGVLFAAGVLG